MKKNYLTKLCLIAAILTLLCFSFCGCSPAPHPKVDGLTDSQVQTLRRSYFDDIHKKNDGNCSCDIANVFITKYLGTYDGKIAIKITDENLQAIEVVLPGDGIEKNIDGIFIGNMQLREDYYLYVPETSSSRAVMKKLDDAYADGCVDKEVLKKIAGYSQSGK